MALAGKHGLGVELGIQCINAEGVAGDEANKNEPNEDGRVKVRCRILFLLALVAGCAAAQTGGAASANGFALHFFARN